MGIIFVAGVHAVGKTTACIHTASLLSLAHYSASDLIRSEKASAISQSGKAVIDVENNQALLIRGAHKAFEQHCGQFILDGHFTLLKPDGEIEAISVDVYRALFLDGIVVYHDEPKAIAERLKDRDKAISDPATIDRHQRFELERAHLVATELSITIRLLEAFDGTGLVQLVPEWMRKAK